MLAYLAQQVIHNLNHIKRGLMLLIILLLSFLQGCSNFVTGTFLNLGVAKEEVSSQVIRRMSFLTTSIEIKPTPTPKPTSTPTPLPSSSDNFATALLGFIYGSFVWIIIPLIILSMLIFSLMIVARVTEPNSKVSVRAGLLAGLVLFVIYVVSQLQSIHVPDLSNYSPHFNLISGIVLLIGFFVGFFFLWGIRILAPTRLVGLLTLILSAASLSALFSYFFASNIRDITLFFALSTVFGILVHVMFFPNTLREIFVSQSFRAI